MDSAASKHNALVRSHQLLMNERTDGHRKQHRFIHTRHTYTDTHNLSSRATAYKNFAFANQQHSAAHTNTHTHAHIAYSMPRAYTYTNAHRRHSVVFLPARSDNELSTVRCVFVANIVVSWFSCVALNSRVRVRRIFVFFCYKCESFRDYIFHHIFPQKPTEILYYVQRSSWTNFANGSVFLAVRNAANRAQKTSVVFVFLKFVSAICYWPATTLIYYHQQSVEKWFCLLFIWNFVIRQSAVSIEKEGSQIYETK